MWCSFIYLLYAFFWLVYTQLNKFRVRFGGDGGVGGWGVYISGNKIKSIQTVSQIPGTALLNEHTWIKIVSKLLTLLHSERPITLEFWPL